MGPTRQLRWLVLMLNSFADQHAANVGQKNPQSRTKADLVNAKGKGNIPRGQPGKHKEGEGATHHYLRGGRGKGHSRQLSRPASLPANPTGSPQDAELAQGEFQRRVIRQTVPIQPTAHLPQFQKRKVS